MVPQPQKLEWACSRKEPHFDEDCQSHLQEKCSNYQNRKIISVDIGPQVQGNKTCWGSTRKEYNEPPQNFNRNEQQKLEKKKRYINHAVILPIKMELCWLKLMHVLWKWKLITSSLWNRLFLYAHCNIHWAMNTRNSKYMKVNEVKKKLKYQNKKKAKIFFIKKVKFCKIIYGIVSNG